MRRKTLAMAVLALPLCSGCVMPNNPFVRDTRAARAHIAAEMKPGQVDQAPSDVVVHPMGYMDLHAVANQPDQGAQTLWLRKLRISLAIAQPVSAAELARMLRARGINITSTLPLESITYSGLGVRDVDGETALQMLFGAMGLDYSLDNVHHFVRIEPMPTKTWHINIGRRITGYQALSATGSGGGGTTGSVNVGQNSRGGGSSGGSGSSTSHGGSGGGSGSSSSGSQSANSDNSSGDVTKNGGIEIDQAEDFWNSLSSEIQSRLTLLVPAPKPAADAARMPMLPTLPAPGAPLSPYSPVAGGVPSLPAPSVTRNGKNEMFVKQQFGVFAMNPETGSITVQAPHWILDKLDKYLTDVQTMYNADITFQGELLMLQTNSTHQEGLDLNMMAQDMGRIGAVVTNNALGGITVSFPNGMNGGMPTIASGFQGSAVSNTPLTSPLLGLVQKNGLSIFNAYLNQIGRVKVMQKPILSTTSGVPGEFARTQTIYYVQVSQQATAGNTGSAAVATTNTLIPVELGTTLRINPRYDVKHDLIRAQISLHQDIQSGTQTFDQYLTGVGSSASAVHTPVPIVTHLSYSGEALLRDGDLIVIGGMHDDQDQDTTQGVPGLMDSILKPFFGQKSQQKTYNTYYFALRVSVHKK